MATLLSGYAESGLSNPKFVRFRASDGAVWSTAGTPAFEVWNNSNVANYGIAATEVTTTGRYAATDPADTTAGDYLLVKAAGASLAVSDLTTGLRWQDRAGPQPANTTHVGGTLQTARDLGNALPAAAPNANGGLPILSSSGTTLGYTLSTVTTVAGLAADSITSTSLAASAATEIAAAVRDADNTSPATNSLGEAVNSARDNAGAAQVYSSLGYTIVSHATYGNAAIRTIVAAIQTVLSGITSLKEWLGLLAGKQTGNSTARTELRSTGAGSGTYDETTDSLEAKQDNGCPIVMSQTFATSNTAGTVGDALNAARAQGFGKWAISGTTLTIYGADGTTVVRSFTLDSATSPTSRT